MSGAVHTRGESLQDGLRDVWTCRMILALAYVLYVIVQECGQTLD